MPLKKSASKYVPPPQLKTLKAVFCPSVLFLVLRNPGCRSEQLQSGLCCLFCLGEQTAALRGAFRGPRAAAGWVGGPDARGATGRPFFPLLFSFFSQVLFWAVGMRAHCCCCGARACTVRDGAAQ